MTQMKLTGIIAFVATLFAVQTAVASKAVVEGKATIAANSSGCGKVYVACVEKDDPAPEFPAPDFEKWNEVEATVHYESDANTTKDFYYFVMPKEGETFYGWGETDGATDLGTDNPLKITASAAVGETITKQCYAFFRLPSIFIGDDPDSPHDWFSPGNWLDKQVPLVSTNAPTTIASGTSVTFDPVGVSSGTEAVELGVVKLGSKNDKRSAALVIESGEFSPAKILIGSADGSCGSVTQNDGTVSLREKHFVIGEKVSDDWSEYVLNGGTNKGANADSGLSVGHYGKGRFVQNGGIYHQEGDVHVARYAGSRGEMFIRGGTFELRENTAYMAWYSNPLLLGEAAPAYLEVGGVAGQTALVDLMDGLEIANGSAAKILTGGTLLVNYVKTREGEGTLLLDGATLKYRHGRNNGENQNTNFVSGLTGLYLGANGATIDDGGQLTLIRSDLTPDPELAGEPCGTLVKTGSGTLAFGSVDKHIRIVVRSGLLGITADEAFARSQVEFQGENGGIELYGCTLTIDDWTGVTTIVNSSDRQATLIVGSDDRDVDLSNVRLSGDIRIVKKGTGALTASRTYPKDLEVLGGTVSVKGGYRYYRVKCDGLISWCGYTDGWAMSELELFNGAKKLDVAPEMVSWDTQVKYSSLTHRDGCTPDKLFDGDFETYMMDVRAYSEGVDMNAYYVNIDACWFQIDFGVPTSVSSYTWYRGPEAAKKATIAGDSYSANDPTWMRLLASDDGETWVELRNTKCETPGVGVGSRSTNEAPVPGGTIDSGLFKGLGELVAAPGTETVVSGGDLNVTSIRAEGDSVVCAPQGAVIFSGDKTFLSGTVASPIVVRDGTLSLYESLWYRFRIRQTSAVTDNTYCEMQELMLFDAAGRLVSGGLIDAGDEVDPLDMPLGSVSQRGAYAHTANEGPEKLFDGRYVEGDSSRWRETSVKPNSGDDLALVMRLPRAAHPVASYSWAMGNGYHLEDPTSWILEVSTDGQTWRTVSDSEDCTVTARGNWVVSGPYEAVPPTLPQVNHFGPDATVRVDAGAKLDVDTAATEIPGLVYDWTKGGGAITCFHPKAGGTLELVNVPAGTSVYGSLGYDIGAVDNIGNLKTWTVTVNGRRKSAALRFRDGDLVVDYGGLVITVR